MQRKQIALHLDVTGSNSPALERIVQIEAIELNTKEKKRFHTFVNPDERIISEKQTALHGLSTIDEEITSAPLFKDVVMDFFKFVKDSDVIMHCAFTHAVLSAACDLAKKKHLKQVAHSVDYTYNLFHELHPECKKSTATLSHIVNHYKLEEFKPRGKTLVTAIEVMKKELLPKPNIKAQTEAKPVALVEEKMIPNKKPKLTETPVTPHLVLLAKPTSSKTDISAKPVAPVAKKPRTKVKLNNDINPDNIIEGRRTRSMFAIKTNTTPAKPIANDNNIPTKKRKRS